MAAVWVLEEGYLQFAEAGTRAAGGRGLFDAHLQAGAIRNILMSPKGRVLWVLD